MGMPAMTRASVALIAAVAIALIAFGLAHPQIARPGSSTKAGEVKCKTVRAAELRQFAARAWPQKRWQRGAPKKSVRRAFKRKLRCAGPGHAKAGKRSWRKSKRAYNRHRVAKYAERRARERQRREIEALTPYDCGSAGRYSIPCAIVACESGYSWSAYNPSGAAGVYQIMPEHGRPWPVRSEADKLAHHRIAASLYRGGAGRSNWVCSG